LGESHTLIGGVTIDVKDLKGKKVKIIRPMTDKEKKAEGWAENYHGTTTVIELEDGTLLYPSCDEEGNGLGVLFCTTSDGKQIAFC